MTTRTVFGSIAMMFVLAFTAQATGKNDLQKYFSDVAVKVKATDNAVEKRQILDESFQTMTKALDMVQNSALIPNEDRASLAHFKAALQEKRDELAGKNGYVRISDRQLNDFSNYVVQDMEQAAETVTISLVTLLLIIILIILIV